MDGDNRHNKIFSNKILYYGKIALVVSSAIFLSYLVIMNINVIIVVASDAIKKFLGALTPVIIGLVLAYLFNRPVMFIEKLLGKIKGRRILSIGILYLMMVGTISLVINFIVPGLQRSLVQLIYFDLPGYSNVISSNFQYSLEWLKSFGLKFDYNNISDYVSQFTNVSSVILDWVMAFVKDLTQGIINIILAMVLAFYILRKKEKVVDLSKELIFLFAGEKARDTIIVEAKEFNNILNGYISGMFIDATIVSILAVIGLNIVGHKYFLLMGIAIGILNMIPYFGAIMGVAIAVLLALFQGVPMALYTLIALIIIQQIDGNILQPRIVGSKVGLEPFWIITAILIFGSYWGIIGMLVAVPFAALIKTILKRIIDKKRDKLKN